MVPNSSFHGPPEDEGVTGELVETTGEHTTCILELLSFWAGRGGTFDCCFNSKNC